MKFTVNGADPLVGLPVKLDSSGGSSPDSWVTVVCTGNEVTPPPSAAYKARFLGTSLTCRTCGNMQWGLTFQRAEPCREEPGWMHPGRCIISLSGVLSEDK